jgi:uncharacterized membrane protein
MPGLLLAIAASVAWGAADFLAGLKSRRLPLLAVLLASQVAGLVLLVPVVLAVGEPPPAGQFVALGALAGAFNAAALAAFYRGLALGRMGIVAAIAATDAVVPLAFGIGSGEQITSVESVGLVLALASVVVVSWAAERGNSETDGSRSGAAGCVGLALIAAACFGCFVVALDASSEGSALWAVAASRTSSVVLIALAGLAAAGPKSTARALVTREPVEVGRRVVKREGPPVFRVSHLDLGPLLVIGWLDVGASCLLAFATTVGLLSQVGMLGSLYPIVTILLARVILRERLDAMQRISTFGVLAGVAMIAAG